MCMVRCVLCVVCSVCIVGLLCLFVWCCLLFGGVLLGACLCRLPWVVVRPSFAVCCVLFVVGCVLRVVCCLLA